MRLLITNHIGNAVESLKSNRLRTFLTVIGVTIGVTSITVVLSMTGGATQFLSSQIKEVDSTIALVRSSTGLSTPDSLLGDLQSLHTTTTLTEKDVADLSNIEGTKVSPVSLLHTSLEAKDGVIDGKHASLIGSNADLLEISNLKVLDGQFLAHTNGVNGIVMGNQLAVDLFGTEYPVGRLVNIRDQTFTVIGVLRPVNQPVNFQGVDFDRSAIIQLDSIKQFTQGVAQVQQIILSTEQPDSFESVIGQTDEILNRNHQGEEDYTILTGKDITAPSSQMFSMIATILAAITGISLLVGGIGIMNIMLVNVAERQREVGIRKAIGATNGHIVNQFLIEAAIIGLLGGVFGYLLGMSLSFLLSLYLPFTPVIDWKIALISIGIAIVTGVIFGIYPAIRAAKKDPIEALHQ